MRRPDFEHDGVSSLIWRLALPAIAAEFVSLLYSMVDRMWIGHMEGTGASALTGLGVCLPLILLITAFGSLFGSNGSAPLVSMALGKGDEEGATRTAGNALSMALITGVLLTLILMVFSRPVLFLFGASGGTIGYAEEYMRTYALGTVPQLITLTLNPVINGMGFALTGMATIWIGAVLNMVLDPIFIFGLGMGIRGAAIASVISQSVSAVHVLSFMFSRKPLIRIGRKDLRPQRDTSLSILRLGAAGFTMKMTTSLVGIVLNRSALLWGGDIYVGAMAILSSIRDIFAPAVFGIADGAGPVMSWNRGSGDMKRVKRASDLCLLYCLAVSFVTWLSIELFPRFFTGLFTDDGGMMDVAVSCTSLYFAGYVFMSFQTAGQKTFTSLGFSRNAIFFSFFRKVFIQIPLALVLPSFMGINGVMLSEPLSNVIGGLACWTTLQRKLRKEQESGK